jgi:hypothetical protein
MDRNLIKDEERKMKQDIFATEIKKENFIREITNGLGEEIKKEPNKAVKKLSFFDKIKLMFLK